MQHVQTLLESDHGVWHKWSKGNTHPMDKGIRRLESWFNLIALADNAKIHVRLLVYLQEFHPKSLLQEGEPHSLGGSTLLANISIWMCWVCTTHNQIPRHLLSWKVPDLLSPHPSTPRFAVLLRCLRDSTWSPGRTPLMSWQLSVPRDLTMVKFLNDNLDSVVICIKLEGTRSIFP